MVEDAAMLRSPAPIEDGIPEGPDIAMGVIAVPGARLLFRAAAGNEKSCFSGTAAVV